MALTIDGGITFGGGINISEPPPTLTIATNDTGGLTGWSPQSLAVAYNAAIISTYPVGSTITFQDSTTVTITIYDSYAPNYIDIFWDIPKTGTIFPITLSN